MKKLLTICAVTSLMLVIASQAEAAVLEVRPPGGVGALGDVYTNIQQAIDEASPGDTINVAAGTYEDDTVGPDGHLVINKANLTLKSAAGKDSTTINVSNGVGIDIQAGASGFVLGGAGGNGFTIVGGTDTSFVIQLVNGPSGVEISHNAIDSTGNASMGVSVGAAGTADLTISDNDFTADTGDGCIWGPGLVNLTVSDNTFDGGSYAVQASGVTSSSPSVISGNAITGFTGSGGIVISNGEGTSGLTISGNTISGCTHGIYFAEYCPDGGTPGDMTTVTVEDNTLSNNTKAIRIGDGAHVLASSFTIQNNCISGSTEYGLENQHASELVNAELNAWGDASGPHHPVVNATGVGDEVSDNVDVYPWYLDCTMTTTVDLPVHNVTQDIYYYTIQSAIDAANSGDQIVVAAGTFVEQLEITIPLTITGAGQGSTIVQSPDDLTLYFTTSSDNYPIVYLHDVADVTIEGLSVDGAGKGNANYRFNGIAFFRAGGTIQNVTLINVMDTPFSGAQHGVAIYAFNEECPDRNINILNCTVTAFQKTAIALSGANAICHVEGCVVTGAGDTTVTAQNGIQFGWGAQGTIKGNTVSDIRYTGPSWSASGILGYGDNGSAPINVQDNTVTNTQGALQIYFFNGDVNVADNNLAGNDFSFLYAFDNGTVAGNSFDNCTEGLYLADITNITVSGNTFSDCNVGLVVDGASDGVSFTDCQFNNNSELGIAVVPYETDNPDNISIECSQIVGNADYGVENTSSNVVDARNNWWGHATGPSGEGGGSGDAVSANVDFFPWLLTTDCGDFTVIVADYVVDDDWAGLPNWSTVTVGGVDYYIGLNAFDTIQEAIDAASDGNNISVAAGTYNEAILIDKSLGIRGATADLNKNGYAVPAGYAWDDTVESIIDHPNPSGGYVTIVDIYDVNDVTFEGFVIQELNAEGNKNSSLVRVYAHTHEISNINVRNNVIGGNTNVAAQDGTQGRMGLYIVNHPYSDKGVVNSTFSGNKIFDCKGNGDNVFIWSSYFAYGAPGPASMRGTVIEDNEIYGSHRAGIETAGGYADLTIRRNTIYGNTGLISDDPNNLKYGNGILLIRGSSDKLGGATTAYGPVNLTIKGNDIFGNEKNGIYSGPILSGVSITGNAMYDNGWDAVRIDLEGTYWNPTFEPEPNDWSCYDAVSDVEVSFNNLFDNGSGVRVVGIPTNGFVVDATYNWWGDTSGPNDPCGTTETDGTTCPDVSVVKNDDGLGDGASENVSYCPWLTTPICTSTNPCLAGDLNYDGCVNLRDLAILAERYLEGCQ